ncbi:uncharacterized protein C5orf34 homolog [Rhinophrynus dorsalis]
MSCLHRSLFLYHDGSVEALYQDGARLRMSPCGSEFVYERPEPSSHSLRKPERRRHRTEFVTSSCRDRVQQVLNFRNTFSCRPFLPSSIIPTENKIVLLTEISEVTWPSLDDNGFVTRLDDGSVKVSSIDGHAHLYMTALRKEFTVEYLCQLSCKISAPHPDCADGAKSDLQNCIGNKVLDEPSIFKKAGSKATYNRNSRYFSLFEEREETDPGTKHAFHYTLLLQRWSVSSCPDVFQYPMGLALHFHLKSSTADERNDPSTHCESKGGSDLKEPGTKWVVSLLPKALPLSCQATHLHRWDFSDLDKQTDIMMYPSPLNVAVCGDITYRFTFEGTSSVEIYPGDGSVFISDGLHLGKYFKHSFLTNDSKKKERTYRAKDLPPDKPRTTYSVRSVITQATRFLELFCWNKLSLNPLSNTCCWKMGLSNETLFPLKSSTVLKHDFPGWCRLHFPNGETKLVQLACPGDYASYIRSAIVWSRRLDEKTQREHVKPITEESSTVLQEYYLSFLNQQTLVLLENGCNMSHRSDVKPCTQKDPHESAENVSEINIQSVLEKTSKAIRDIDSLLSSRK